MKTGEQFLGGSGSTDEVSAFENQYIQSTTGQITRTDQGVVATANDDCVVVRHVMES